MTQVRLYPLLSEWNDVPRRPSHSYFSDEMRGFSFYVRILVFNCWVAERACDENCYFLTRKLSGITRLNQPGTSMRVNGDAGITSFGPKKEQGQFKGMKWKTLIQGG